MKNNLYKIILGVLILASILSACNKDVKNIDENNTPSNPSTAAPTTVAVSTAPVAFIFLDNEMHMYYSLYHQLAMLKMESNGYNVSSVYAGEDQDMLGTFSQLELNGCEYVIITSSKLSDQVQNYLQYNSSSMVFIQSGDYYIDTYVSYDIKLYEYYYLAGVALCQQSTTNIAGFVAISPNEQTIRCINAFALGMKSVNADSLVIVSWANSTTDETHISELIDSLTYQQCDVFAYFMSGDLVEKVASNSGTYYMSMSTHTMLDIDEKLIIKPVVNLDLYYAQILGTSKVTLENIFEYLGVGENIVSFELSISATDDTKNKVQSANASIQAGLDVFAGPIFNEFGLVVSEDSSLPESDVLAMLWFVDNVVGDLPAG